MRIFAFVLVVFYIRTWLFLWAKKDVFKAFEDTLFNPGSSTPVLFVVLILLLVVAAMISWCFVIPITLITLLING